LLPIALITLLRSGNALVHSHSGHEIEEKASKSSWVDSTSLIVLATLSAAIVLNVPFISSTTAALGLSSVVFTALSLLLLGVVAKDEDGEESREAHLENGSTGNKKFSGQFGRESVQRNKGWLVLRDFAITVTLLCVLGSIRIEDFHTRGITVVPANYDADLESPDPLDHVKKHWKIVPQVPDIQIWITMVGALRNAILLLNVSASLYWGFVSVIGTGIWVTSLDRNTRRSALWRVFAKLPAEVGGNPTISTIISATPSALSPMPE